MEASVSLDRPEESYRGNLHSLTSYSTGIFDDNVYEPMRVQAISSTERMIDVSLELVCFIYCRLTLEQMHHAKGRHITVQCTSSTIKMMNEFIGPIGRRKTPPFICL